VDLKHRFEIRFVDEAIRCMRADALLAAAFMIGAASERAINLLIQTYGEAIRDESKMIPKRYEEFCASYRSCRSRPSDPALAPDLDVLIGKMFQCCRITRNEVGHPPERG
jgi:hypothetical protein